MVLLNSNIPYVYAPLAEAWEQGGKAPGRERETPRLSPTLGTELALQDVVFFLCSPNFLHCFLTPTPRRIHFCVSGRLKESQTRGSRIIRRSKTKRERGEIKGRSEETGPDPPRRYRKSKGKRRNRKGKGNIGSGQEHLRGTDGPWFHLILENR